MEKELTYPRYDDDGNLIERPPVIQTEEEEVLEEDGGILNATQASQSSVAQTILFSQTMQMQREIFVLKGDYITPQDAEDFYEQAQHLPRLRINECMQRQAIDLLHVKIMTDVNHFSEMTQEQRFEWQTVLDIDYIAKLIMQYFGSNKQRDHGDHTLAELFAKVPFHYSLNSDEEELSTYMAYKELVSNYELPPYHSQPICGVGNDFGKATCSWQSYPIRLF